MFTKPIWSIKTTNGSEFTIGDNMKIGDQEFIIHAFEYYLATENNAAGIGIENEKGQLAFIYTSQIEIITFNQ